MHNFAITDVSVFFLFKCVKLTTFCILHKFAKFEKMSKMKTMFSQQKMYDLFLQIIFY